MRVGVRRPVREAGGYAGNPARKTGKRVTTASKDTIQQAADGLFERESKEVAEGYPEVPHNVELFDALLGKLGLEPPRAAAPNRVELMEQVARGELDIDEALRRLS